MPALLDRIAADLAVDLRAWSLTGPRARGGLRTASATVLATLVALALHLDDPWWAAITGVVIVQADAAGTLSRSIDRVVGTVIGAAIGFAASATIADHVLFLSIAAAATAFTLYAQERARHSYAYLLCGITVILVMFGSLTQPDRALSLAVDRALAIIVSVVVACIVDYALSAPAERHATAAVKPGVWTAPIDRELAAVAIAGGIAIGLIPLIWETLELPGLGETPITAFVIVMAMRQEPGWKALTRATGCLLGAIYGLTAMHFVGGSFVPWVIMLFVGVYLAAHIHHGGGDGSYVGMQAAIAIVMAMVQGEGPSADILPAINRLTGVFGGILVVSLCHPLFAPLVRRLIRPAA